MPTSERPVAAALMALIILQVTMLASLFAGVAPHPPAQTPLFGLAPFVGGAIGAAASALVIGARTGPAGHGLSLAAVLLALISFGPQKYFDAQFGLIWPAVITGQIAIATVVVCVLQDAGRMYREKAAQ